MENKKTMVIGASEKPERFSFKAIQLLRNYGHDVVALAKRKGKVLDVDIQTEFPDKEKIHTVTLYIGREHQKEYFEPVVKLKPQRVIFNPGTENYEFETLLNDNGIATVQACTLIMLNAGKY